MQVTALALTKLDSTAKGGVVIGISDELKLPVRFVGVGETVEDLQPFDPHEFVNALFAYDAPARGGATIRGQGRRRDVPPSTGPALLIDALPATPYSAAQLTTSHPIDARTDEGLLATPLDSASPADPAPSRRPPPRSTRPPSTSTPSRVLRHLRRNGHQAYLVGGFCDLLLGRRPKDFDIATSAHPEEVRATFRNCRLIGRRFRLAHIYFKGQKIIEVSTFRKNPVEEVLAEDPSAVDTDLLISEDNVFGTAEEDARRRDFTINGLFYDVGLGEVIDYVSGRSDLATRTIRTIGTPEIRLREDPVRLLRAVRFAAKLDLIIDPETWTAMQHGGRTGELACYRCRRAFFEETLRLLHCGQGPRAAGSAPAAFPPKWEPCPSLLPSVAAFLEQSPPIEAERLFGVMGAMDERIVAGIPTDDSLLLAALLLRIVQAWPLRPTIRNPRRCSAIEPVIAELTRTARLPRRIAGKRQAAALGPGRALLQVSSAARLTHTVRSLTQFRRRADPDGRQRPGHRRGHRGPGPLAGTRGRAQGGPGGERPPRARPNRPLAPSRSARLAAKAGRRNGKSLSPRAALTSRLTLGAPPSNR